MQLRSKITVVRDIRSHHHSLLNAKCKTDVVVLSLEVADGMVSLKTTFKQRKSDSTPFTWHPISI